MSIFSLIQAAFNSPEYKAAQSRTSELVNSPWYKLTENDLSNFNAETGKFNSGYDPYPGMTIWSGGNVATQLGQKNADLNSFYALPSGWDANFRSNIGSNDASGGFMGDLSRGITEMKPGLSIMALPFLGAGITSAMGGAVAGGAAAGGAEAGAGTLYAGETAAGVGSSGVGLGGTGGGATGLVSGGTGSASLLGDAGADTLGGETLFPGESATSGSAVSNGGGMWDLVDEVGFDPGGEGMFNAPLAEDTSTGAFDQFGMNNPNTGFPDQGFDPGGSWLDSLKQYGQQGMDVYNKLKAIPAIAALLGSAAGKTGGKTGGQSTGGGILGNILSDPLGSAFNASPFLLAMAEANRQGNKTDPILARLSGLADQAGSNEGGLLSSVTGPYNRQTMAGRDSLMSDQSLRGVRGSSFGDQSLTSYDTTRSQGLGELTGSTQAKSIGLQGGLLNQLLAGQTQAATSRNLLLGAGLNASGKLFQPQSDPFGLQNLLGLK